MMPSRLKPVGCPLRQAPMCCIAATASMDKVNVISPGPPRPSEHCAATCLSGSHRPRPGGSPQFPVGQVRRSRIGYHAPAHIPMVRIRMGNRAVRLPRPIFAGQPPGGLTSPRTKSVPPFPQRVAPPHASSFRGPLAPFWGTQPSRRHSAQTHWECDVPERSSQGHLKRGAKATGEEGEKGISEAAGKAEAKRMERANELGSRAVRQLPLLPSDGPLAVWPAEGSNTCPPFRKRSAPLRSRRLRIFFEGRPRMSRERFPLAYPQGAGSLF
jgi:hypothetical protein